MSTTSVSWCPRIENDLIAIPCTLFRGGTSKGPAFLASDLPGDPGLRNQIILSALNSSHPRQVDGIGGAETLSNKVVIVSPSQRSDADVDYKFLQLSPNSPRVGEEGTCGNMATVVGPFALESGLVTALPGETTVRIFAVDAQLLLAAKVQTPDGQVSYAGEARVSGVDAPAAPVELTYLPPYGVLSGALFPTGRRQDIVDGVPVTIVEAGGGIAMIFPAQAVGKTGYEGKAELDADHSFAARIEPLRCSAGALIGLGDVRERATPKPIMVAPACRHGTISARDLVTQASAPHHCHPAHSGSGAVALALAAALPGTVPYGHCDHKDGGAIIEITIEHPCGEIKLVVRKQNEKDEGAVSGVSLTRTCRKLFRGELYVARSVLGQQRVA